MKNKFLLFVFLVALTVSFLTIKAISFNIPPEPPTPVPNVSTAVPTVEVKPSVTAEATKPVTAETSTATVSATALSSKETISGITTETSTITTEASTVETVFNMPTEEGSMYKGVPWGADFDMFKKLKKYSGNLVPFSAAFVSSMDDNDIALLLGVPVSAKTSNGEQRVMFEYVPQKFASVYIEADDTHYIFYGGKYAMTFSKINWTNFDLYRDTLYKKYTKTGSFSKKYLLGKKKYYQTQASIFEKGKTSAFLIKSQYNDGKKSFISAKLVFGYVDMLNTIRSDIQEKIANEKVVGSEKEKIDLQRDLNKIE